MKQLKHSFSYSSKHHLLFSDDESSYSKAMIYSDDHTARAALANRVKAAIAKLGRGGKRAVAEKCNISEQAITGWIKTGRIDKKHLVVIAEMTNTPLIELITGTTSNQQSLQSNATFGGDFDFWDDESPLNDDEVALPLFKEVEISAGSGRYEVMENSDRKLRFAKSTLRRCGVMPQNAACAKIAGNSMEPVIPDGTTIGIDTGSTTIKDGEIYAIDHDGHLRIKILYQLPGGVVRVRSYNSDEWPDEHYSDNDAKKIRIIGRVFWWSVLR